MSESASSTVSASQRDFRRKFAFDIVRDQVDRELRVRGMFHAIYQDAKKHEKKGGLKAVYDRLKALDDKAKGGEGRVGPTEFPAIEWPEALQVPPPWEGGDGKAINQPERARAAKLDKAARP